MPNQLSKSKKRQSLAEHAAVLAALGEISREEGRPVMDLLREAARDFVRRKADTSVSAEKLRRAVMEKAPEMPARFETPAQVARFKRAQREFDQVLLDLALVDPQELQARNSIVSRRRSLRIVDFDRAHAAAAV